MGRPKTYDRLDVTRKAMTLFWTQGFAATSTKDLACHMGINAYSLFAEFESKQALFEAALALYREEVVANIFAGLDKPDAGLDEIVAILDLFAAMADAPGAGRGCFACNVATERAAGDAASQESVAAHFAYLENGFYRALSIAQARGQLRADVSCVDQSRLLVSVVVGFSVLMRAGIDGAFVANGARAARQELQHLRT